ncbi:MAG: hypothetical protein HEP71_07890 [Roseivirga sp.]|nr:hypothetical protein [Roseivirga sp.]
MSTTLIIEELEGLFKAGAKPTEDHFKKLINTYLVNNDNKVGIGTDDPKNTLDVRGQAVIGDGFGGEETAPTNGLIVEGNVGIGHKFADEALHVKGSLKLEDGGLIIGGQPVINEAGVWLGKFPVEEDEEEEPGSLHWTDGNGKVTTAVKVGIGESSPSADLHVKGNVQIDEGNLNLSGLVTKKEVAFTAHGYKQDDSEKENRIIFQAVLPQAQPSPFNFFQSSVFQPDAAHAGTYFLTVSITMTEGLQESEAEPGKDDGEVSASPEGTGKPKADGGIFFSTDGGSTPLLVVRHPGSSLHSGASIVCHFDGNTALSLHTHESVVEIDHITLTGYRI